MTPTCIICTSNQTFSFPPKYMAGKLWKCKNCDVAFVHPQPAHHENVAVYDDVYFKNEDSNIRGYTDYLGDEKNIKKTFQRRWEKLRSDLNREKPDLQPKVLDVGCAYGFFLDVAREGAWETWGIDISDHAAGIARKHHGNQIQKESFLNTQLPSSYFNLITMWDYLEHSLDPKSDVFKAHQLLAKDGLLVITTTDTSSLPAKLTKHRWMGFKVEEHLCFFSKDALCRLLENSGFKIQSVSHVGKFITPALFWQRLSLYFPFLKPLFDRISQMKVMSEHSIYMNPMDIIMVVAKKAVG